MAELPDWGTKDYGHPVLNAVYMDQAGKIYEAVKSIQRKDEPGVLDDIDAQFGLVYAYDVAGGAYTGAPATGAIEDMLTK